MHKLLRFVYTVVLLASTLVTQGANDSKLALLLRDSRPEASTGKLHAPCMGGLWKTENFGIDLKIYDQGNFQEGFASDLARAKLLVLGWRCDKDLETILSDKTCREAVKAFLANGGTIYCDFGASFEGPNSKAFLKEIGVELKRQKPPYPNPYPLEVAKDATHHLVRTPTDIEKLPEPYYGHYPTFVIHPGQIPLMTVKNEPNHCGILLQEGVLDKGRIVACCVYGQPHLFIQNLLTAVFGPLAKGQEVALGAAGAVSQGNADKNSLKAPPTAKPLNPLYLRGAGALVWHKPEWGWRLPLAVMEPLGQRRVGMIVSFAYAFPKDTDPSSFRVVTPGGNELPCQSLLLDKEKNLHRVTFAIDILANDTACVLLYFDNKPKPKPDYPSRLSLRREADTFVLENSQIRADLRAAKPVVAYLAPQDNPTGNQLYRGDINVTSLSAGSSPYLGDSSCRPASVIEDGPVCKTLEYLVTPKPPIKPFICRFTMNIVSNCLFYEIASTDGTPVNRAYLTAWFPGEGKSLDEDFLVYPGKDGIRKIGVSGNTEDLLPKALNELAEGWYAFEDSATGQTVGGLFDLSTAKRISFSCTGAYTPVISHQSPMTIRAGLVALPDHSSAMDVRNAYLKFKFPPECAMGEIQERASCPATPVKPELGKDFLLGWQMHWSPVRIYHQEDGAAMAANVGSRLRDAGFNQLDIWATPTYFFDRDDPNYATTAVKPFMEGLEKSGFMLSAMPPAFLHPRAWERWGDLGKECASLYKDNKMSYLDYKKFAEKVAERVAGNPFNMLNLADESGWRIQSGDIPVFKERYGVEPATAFDPAKPATPANINTVLFQMDAYTAILKAMSEKAKAVNPKMLLSDQVNVSGMYMLGGLKGNPHMMECGGPHDWEKQGEYLDTISMDLYDQPRDLYKYWAKHMRSMFGNRKAVTELLGCTTPSDRLAASYGYAAMWGVTGIVFFQPRDTDILNVQEELRRVVGKLAFTKLGALAATMRPATYLAILRDRAGMIDYIKKGQWNTVTYDARIGKVAAVRNLQSDMVMSRFLNQDTLKDYAALYVPEDPVIADQFIAVIEEYVKAGGVAILEGDTLLNPKAQALCGVRHGGSGNIRTKCVAGGFSYAGRSAKLTPDGATVSLAFEDGSPVLLERKLGKGSIVCLPFLLSEKVDNQDDLKGFLRKQVERLAGKPQYSIDTGIIKDIDSNLLSDGKGGYLFCAINMGFEPKTVTMTWNGATTPAETTDFDTGETKPFNGKLTLDLPSWGVKFISLGPKGFVPVPANQQAEDHGSSYSSKPGKDVMDYRASAKKQSSGAERPAKQSGISYVAVWDPGMPENESSGAGPIFDALRDKKGLKIEKIASVDPKTLAYFDAVVVPNFGTSPTGIKDWEKNVRDYVLNGGATLLCHRAAGYTPCAFVPFPEIGTPGQKVVKERDIKILASHPLSDDLSIRRRYPDDYMNPAYQGQMDATAFKIGETYQFGFCDYVPIIPAKGAVVVAESIARSEPVVVVGKAGKGKVVMAGMGIGQDDIGNSKMADGDAKLLLNAIYWLTEK